MRIVITTVAFGMRIQIPDIDLVIHWGPSDIILMYWQEVGRRARDGRPGKTKFCLPPYVLADKIYLLTWGNSANRENVCVK